MVLEEQNCYPGCIPEFGAIFMSSTETKEECFRRKLFGLPSGQATFVKQIKAGMVLFLFEFNKRQLHGVYQASTDGAMNIVPHAYSSSGMLFPAQVKITHLWHCSPLSEDEFREAIKENYFSAKKFNFGLSEDQVQKLLFLFNLKRLKPQRHITKCKDARYSVNKFRRAADDPRSIAATQGEEVNVSLGSIIPTDNYGVLLGNDGRAVDDEKFATRARPGLVGAAPISTFYPGQFEVGSTFFCSMKPQAMSHSCPTSSEDALVANCQPYDPDAPGIKSRHFSSYEHTSNPVQNFASPHNSIAENFLPLSENQFSLSYTEPRGARSPDFSSVLGYGAPIASHDHYGNSQRTRMSFLETSYFENMASNPSENEGYRRFSLPRTGPFPFSDSGNSDGANQSTSYSFSPSQYPSFVFDYGGSEASQDNDQKMLQRGNLLKEGKSQLLGSAYPVKFNYIDNHDSSSLKPDDVSEDYGGMYSDCQKNRKSVFSRLALAPKAHIRKYDTLVGVDEDMMDTSVDEVMSRLYQSLYQPSQMRKKRQLFNVETADFRKRQSTSHSKLAKDRLKKMSDEVIMNHIPASEENSEQFVEKTPFVDFKRRSELQKRYHIDSKIGGCDWSAETEGFAGRLDKRRKLIRPNFSKNELIDTVNVDTPKKVELLPVTSHVSQADSGIEAERVSTSKLESVETFEANFSNLIGTISVSISEGLTNKDSVVDGLFQDLNSSTHSVQQESTLEADNNIEAERISTRKQESVEGFGATFSNLIEVGKDLSQNVDVGTIAISTSEGLTNKDSVVDGLFLDLSSSTHFLKKELALEADNNNESERVSTCEQESFENFGATFSNLIEVGKESSQNFSIETIPVSISKGLTNKDSVVDELYQDLNSTTHSVQQESTLEACEKSNDGIASDEIECSRNMQESDPNTVLGGKATVDMVSDFCKLDSNTVFNGDVTVDMVNDLCKSDANTVLDGEVAVDMVNVSCNQTRKLESTCKVFKVDVQQNDDDDGNAFLSSSCEIISGQSKTISSN